MTKDELFKKFWEESHCTDYLARRKFDEIIAPHLAIPRSLKDDPPDENQLVVLLAPGNSCGGLEWHSWRLGQYAKHPPESRWTHWIPCPGLPKPDKDEQEFEEWVKGTDIELNAQDNRPWRDACKRSWLAARGKK